MKKILFGLIFVFVFSAFVTAQKQADEYNKVEVYAGYSGAFQANSDDSLTKIDNGFNVAAVYNFHRYIGIRGDFSGSYQKYEGDYFSPFGTPPISPARYRFDHTLYNATVGVQFKNNKRQARLKPFGHVLVGYGKHQDNFKTACPAGAVCPPFDSNFKGVSFIIGGGLDIKLNRRIDIRAIQLDLNSIGGKIGGQSTTYSAGRIGAGIVFKF